MMGRQGPTLLALEDLGKPPLTDKLWSKFVAARNGYLPRMKAVDLAAVCDGPGKRFACLVSLEGDDCKALRSSIRSGLGPE
jgi:hypothetical protein